MSRSIYVPVLLLCFVVGNSARSKCYSDFCANNTVLPSESEHRCMTTPLQTNIEACRDFDFPTAADKVLGNFELAAYLYETASQENKYAKHMLTAFNLSITDIKFDRLYIRYRKLDNDNFSTCREIRLYDNGKDPMPTELFVKCPFLHATGFYKHDFTLEILASKDDDQYTRTFVFGVPDDRTLRKDDKANYAPFMYVDVTDRYRPHLHIQSAPATFNVTGYNLWLSTQDSRDSKKAELKLVKTFTNNETLEYILEDFPHTGCYQFIATLVHPDCSAYGCLNTTTPITDTCNSTRRLIITIISTIWIPPAILYAIYRIYSLCRQRKLDEIKHRETYCLLVSSPTHIAHVEVMTDLTNYLRSCNIKAQFDQMDISNTFDKNPTRWCDDAFKKSDIIIMVSSPPSNHIPVPVVYTDVDKRAVRLMNEHYPNGEKKYFALLLPYCNVENLPLGAKMLRKFNIPEDLDKLVRVILGDDYIQIVGKSREKLLDSIELAKTAVMNTELEKREYPEETGNTIRVMTEKTVIECDDDKISIMREESMNRKNSGSKNSVDEISINGDVETNVEDLLDGDKDSEELSLISIEPEDEPETRIEDFLNL